MSGREVHQIQPQKSLWSLRDKRTSWTATTVIRLSEKNTRQVFLICLSAACAWICESHCKEALLEKKTSAFLCSTEQLFLLWPACSWQQSLSLEQKNFLSKFGFHHESCVFQLFEQGRGCQKQSCVCSCCRPQATKLGNLKRMGNFQT